MIEVSEIKSLSKKSNFVLHKPIRGNILLIQLYIIIQNYLLFFKAMHSLIYNLIKFLNYLIRFR